MSVLRCSYNTYNSHYKEVQCFQKQVEPLLYRYGVNFVFFGKLLSLHTRPLVTLVTSECLMHVVLPAMADLGIVKWNGLAPKPCENGMHVAGHVHAYERSWPVYNYKLNPCGPLNIIIGELVALLSICHQHIERTFQVLPNIDMMSLHVCS